MGNGTGEDTTAVGLAAASVAVLVVLAKPKVGDGLGEGCPLAVGFPQPEANSENRTKKAIVCASCRRILSLHKRSIAFVYFT